MVSNSGSGNFKCLHCSRLCVKAGKTAHGEQGYRCDACFKYQKASYKYLAWKPEINRWLVGLVKENCGIEGIKRLLHISKSTILRRIKIISNLVQKPIPIFGHIYEVDELRTYVGNRNKPVWIAYALDRETRLVVDLRVGSRTKRTLEGLVQTLIYAQAKQIYTDGLDIYRYLIPKEIHKVTRFGTNRIERKNLDLRTHLKRLNRRSTSFSRSLAMLRASLRVYFWGDIPITP